MREKKSNSVGQEENPEKSLRTVEACNGRQWDCMANSFISWKRGYFTRLISGPKPELGNSVYIDWQPQYLSIAQFEALGTFQSTPKWITSPAGKMEHFSSFEDLLWDLRKEFI